MTERTNRDADQKWDDLITRALQEPGDEGLPPGFAAMVATRAEAAAEAPSDRPERWMQGAFVAGLALATLALFGSDLAALLQAIVAGGDSGPSAAIGWSGAIAVCLALTLVVEIWATNRLFRQQRALRQSGA